jgi:cyclic lactone autoinducer peptide
MAKWTAKLASYLLNRVSRYFVQTASPNVYRPEIPEELK